MRRALAVVLVAVALGQPGAARANTPPSAAAPMTDSLFPRLGNPGIDVQHYDVELTFDHPSGRLAGRVTATLLATAHLDTIVFDSRGPQISAVTVDGRAATYTGGGGKLRITPPTPVDAGAEVSVAIDYSVDTEAVHATAGVGPGSAGWFNSAKGSYVLNEPDGAHSWLPSNDHPSDKATWTFRITVGHGLTAIANGTLGSHVSSPTGEVWTWDQAEPMATYLIQLLTGHYTLSGVGTAPSGVKLLDVSVADASTDMKVCREVTLRQLAFFTNLFGPYPFSTYGIAVTDSFPGLAMETQGRSTFSAADLGDCAAGDGVLAHELAHQWFGDAVSPADWGDIWLNESFATYCQWLWSEHAGGLQLDSYAASAAARRGRTPTGKPTVADMFGINSYDGGAVVLHALRRTVGDQAFFTIMRQWVQANKYASRRTADFITLAERVSGTSLTEFFKAWLYADEVPAEFPAAKPGSPSSEPVEHPAAPASWFAGGRLAAVDAGRQHRGPVDPQPAERLGFPVR